ncbi:MAG TPA: NADH-quinone oxidoreductase subunit C, partial [Anaerolineales bacterium]|nr:NADH-quinone oxidoreductase subunit C [Anaerolineales bacterium]
QKTVDVLKTKFPETVVEVIEFRGETTIVIKPESLLAVCQFVKDDPELGYRYLVDLAGVDYYPDEPRFGISYIVFAMGAGARIRIKVLINGDDPTVDSVVGVWRNADWYEREAFDMLGIKFNNHPDLRRILMPADWVGHPHRKDYPLGYEEVQFSFNWREVDAKKPYAKE